MLFCPVEKKPKLLQLVDALFKFARLKASVTGAQGLQDDLVCEKRMGDVIAVIDYAVQESEEVWAKTAVS